MWYELFSTDGMQVVNNITKTNRNIIWHHTLHTSPDSWHLILFQSVGNSLLCRFLLFLEMRQDSNKRIINYNMWERQQNKCEPGILKIRGNK